MGKKKSNKAMEPMARIPIDTNIAKFLSKVQEEVNAVYDRYDLPRNLYQPHDLTIAFAEACKRHQELFNHSEEMGLPFAYDLYQAGIVFHHIEKSKKYLADNQAEKLAHSVGSIVEIMASKYDQAYVNAGRRRLGYKKPWTIFLKDVIYHSKKENPDFNSTDVINNIEPFFIANESDYPSINVEAILGEQSETVGFNYKTSSEGEKTDGDTPDIKLNSLVTIINRLKKEI